MYGWLWRTFPGGHFYPESSQAALLAAILSERDFLRLPPGQRVGQRAAIDVFEFAADRTIARQGEIGTGLFTNTPLLCASCHLSEALPGTGQPGRRALTASMHAKHATVIDPTNGLTLDASANRSACYRCHPGSTTKCLRGVMGAAVKEKGEIQVLAVTVLTSLDAADLAAMSPGTSTGAAHPVAGLGQMDEVMSKKVTSAMAAYIRSKAERRALGFLGGLLALLAFLGRHRLIIGLGIELLVLHHEFLFIIVEAIQLLDQIRFALLQRQRGLFGLPVIVEHLAEVDGSHFTLGKDWSAEQGAEQNRYE